MISRYPVFIPKLLPRDEYFVSGRRSCKGCGKALAARMVSKMMGKDVTFGYPKSSLSGYVQAGVGLTWDELSSDDLTDSLINRIITESERAREAEGITKRIRKAAIGIDRRIFLKDPLALTGILKRQKGILYICWDSEMYMDELIRRNLPSLDNHAEGHSMEKDGVRDFIQNKDIPSQVREDCVDYAATACPSYPLDLMEKVEKGLQVPGNAFINVLTPCPTTWLFNPDLTAHMGFLAVNTGFYPLVELESGKLKVTKRVIKLQPLADYFKVQQRYIPFPPELMSLMQEVVIEEYENLTAGTEGKGK